MKKNIYRDIKKWNNYLLSESKIKMLKSLISNVRIDSFDRVKAAFILNKQFKNASKSKIVNRCVLTGRGNSILRPFALSWMQFKDFAQQGLIPGVKRWNF